MHVISKSTSILGSSAVDLQAPLNFECVGYTYVDTGHHTITMRLPPISAEERCEKMFRLLHSSDYLRSAIIMSKC